MIEQRIEFLEKLEKYEVDPGWLKEQQTSLYQDRIKSQVKDLQERAQAIESDLFMQEHDNIMSLI